MIDGKNITHFKRTDVLSKMKHVKIGSSPNFYTHMQDNLSSDEVFQETP